MAIELITSSLSSPSDNFQTRNIIRALISETAVTISHHLTKNRIFFKDHTHRPPEIAFRGFFCDQRRVWDTWYGSECPKLSL